MRNINIEGFITNYDKFEALKIAYWRCLDGDSSYMCKKHDTYFDISEEPCWQCYHECEEKE